MSVMSSSNSSKIPEAHSYVRTRFLFIHFASDRNFQQDGESAKRTLIQQRICMPDDVEVWGIPPGTRDPSSVVKDKLLRFKQERNAVNELLIVMYGGHARAIGPKALVWGSADGQQFVSWNPIQDDTLLPGGKDTLLILDCCHAGAAQRTIYDACKDILAACAWDKTTPEITLELGAFTVKDLFERTMSLGPRARPVHQKLPSTCGHLITLTPHPAYGSPGASGTSNRATTSASTPIYRNSPASAKQIDWIEFEIGLAPLRFKFRTHFRSGSRSLVQSSSSLETDHTLERLDLSAAAFPPGYRLEDSSFFKQGRIFAILWPSDVSNSRSSRASVPSTYQERILVVISSDNQSAYATPYGSTISPDVARPSPNQEAAGVTLQQLDPGAMKNVGKVYRIMFNVPVRKVGSISGKDLAEFLGGFKMRYDANRRRDSGVSSSTSQPVFRSYGASISERNGQVEYNQYAQRSSATSKASATSYSSQERARFLQQASRGGAAQTVQTQPSQRPQQRYTAGYQAREESESEEEEDDDEGDSNGSDSD